MWTCLCVCHASAHMCRCGCQNRLQYLLTCLYTELGGGQPVTCSRDPYLSACCWSYKYWIGFINSYAPSHMHRNSCTTFLSIRWLLCSFVLIIFYYVNKTKNVEKYSSTYIFPYFCHKNDIKAFCANPYIFFPLQPENFPVVVWICGLRVQDDGRFSFCSYMMSFHCLLAFAASHEKLVFPWIIFLLWNTSFFSAWGSVVYSAFWLFPAWVGGFVTLTELAEMAGLWAHLFRWLREACGCPALHLGPLWCTEVCCGPA